MNEFSAEKYAFRPINAGYNRVFKQNKLSIGLVVPIENYANSPVPTLKNHIERIQLAESLGFSAIWLRDVPFNVPSFGDAGQLYDPFVYLGALALQTSRITLGVASIILPFHHPAQVAKSAASIDDLSNGRLVLGIGTGDRPQEFTAFNVRLDQRGELFREGYDYIRELSKDTPNYKGAYGKIGSSDYMQMLPKPVSNRLPLLITGSSQQSPDWIAEHGDGWMTYPRPEIQQSQLIRSFRSQIEENGKTNKPVMEPLYIDLSTDPDRPPTPIHLGFHIGINPLREYLLSRERIGVNHVALNLRFNGNDIDTTLGTLAEELLPQFTHQENNNV